MQRKFRDIVQGKSKKKLEASELAERQDPHPQTPTKHVRQSSAPEQSQATVHFNASKRSSLTSSRSRPLNAIFSDRRESNTVDCAPAKAPSAHSDHKVTRLTPIVLENAYDANPRGFMTLGGDRRLITGESEGKHEEDVADRNINRYSASMDVIPRKPLPNSRVSSLPDVGLEQQRKPSCAISSASSFDSTDRSIPSTMSSEKYVVGQEIATQGGLIDRILPHAESLEHEKAHWKRAGWPARAARDEYQLGQRSNSGKIPRFHEGHGGSPPLPSEEATILRAKSAERHRKDSGLPTLSVDCPSEFQRVGDARAKQQGLGLAGVINLSNTVETDQNVQWAPSVTHEVVKPHEHEIVQHNIHREIHNYSYYHRLQPVIDTEILPPRHFIPHPTGEGLFEISAEEVPKYTADDRQWDIIARKPSSSISRIPLAELSMPEPESDGQKFSPEGFQRKETIINHPPTLADLSTYSGAVQPVHFDHKTGDCWVGDLTTMDKINGQFDAHSSAEALNLRGLDDALPRMPQSTSTRRV